MPRQKSGKIQWVELRDFFLVQGGKKIGHSCAIIIFLILAIWKSLLRKNILKVSLRHSLEFSKAYGWNDYYANVQVGRTRSKTQEGRAGLGTSAVIDHRCPKTCRYAGNRIYNLRSCYFGNYYVLARVRSYHSVNLIGCRAAVNENSPSDRSDFRTQNADFGSQRIISSYTEPEQQSQKKPGILSNTQEAYLD